MTGETLPTDRRQATTQRKFGVYLDELVQACREHASITALVVMGSTADRSRVDEWSDHDFAVVCVNGVQEELRKDLSWLPRANELVLAVREDHDGFKAIYGNGAVIEFAVVDHHELSTFYANRWEVLYDTEGATEVMNTVVGKVVPSDRPQPSRDLGVFLAAILIGAGRARRGELLSASGTIRGFALDHLLQVFRECAAAELKSELDNLDPRRRFELAFPNLAEEIDRSLAMNVEACARGLLDTAQYALNDKAVPFPKEAADVIRTRLGWERTER
jgi:hypothetical protein